MSCSSFSITLSCSDIINCYFLPFKCHQWRAWDCFSFKPIICALNWKAKERNTKYTCAGRQEGLVVWQKRSPYGVGSWQWPRSQPSPARRHWRKPVLNLQAWSHQNNICVFALQFCVHGWKENWRGGRHTQQHSEQSTEMSKQAAAHTRQLCVTEKRAVRHRQHCFWSYCSAGNYDNNVFPRRPLCDLVSQNFRKISSL